MQILTTTAHPHRSHSWRCKLQPPSTKM
ncbi:unnamed protein product [Linum tenue]|uniref:Uncharacterized protein n=1 Tax=Linum tenue TaxID=586396 RepID=A0AAV0RRB8_9ROSI|nr:unnamed protein product [Linum tenue]